MRMGISKISILSTMLSLQEHYKKTYTCLKRVTIQDRLKNYHHISISLSAIDNHLGELKKLGFIKVYQRRGHTPNGKIYNKASNRMITKRAILYLLIVGVKISTFLFKKIFKFAPVFPKRVLTQKQLQKIMGSPGASQDEKAEAHSAMIESMQFKPA